MLRYSSLTWIIVQHDQWVESIEWGERHIRNAVQGYLVYKRRGERTYCYLQQRHGDTVLSHYIGRKDDPQVTEIERAIETRKTNEKWNKSLSKRVAILRKIIRTVVARIAKRISRRKDRTMSEYEAHLLTQWGKHSTPPNNSLKKEKRKP